LAQAEQAAVLQLTTVLLVQTHYFRQLHQLVVVKAA
jgi:hypothetical protein